MLGPKVTTVFKSRWNALFWAGSVLLTAYCSVPSQDGNDASSAAIAAVAQKAQAMGTQSAGSDEHRNPWSKDPVPAHP